MKPGMSPCRTRTSLVAGLTSRIWPWSWYCFVGAARLHAVRISIASRKRRIPYTLNVRKWRVQKDPPSRTEERPDYLYWRPGPFGPGLEEPRMIWVGTSGYNYPEWKGNFYPEK